MKKIIIFDLDDTLVKCDFLYINAKNKFLRIMEAEFGEDIDIKEIEKELTSIDIKRVKVFGGPKERYFESMLLVYFGACYKYNKKFSTKIELKLKKITMFNNALTDVELFSETLNVLTKLKEEKYPMFLFTIGDLEWQNFKMDKFKLSKYFNKIFYNHFKTELQYKQILLEINSSNEIDYENFIMIGNSLNSDIIPANNIGMITIYLNRNEEKTDLYAKEYYKSEDHKDLKNNYEINNLDGIFEVLGKIKDK